MTPQETVSHVRSLHSTAARAYVRKLDSLEHLSALRDAKLRRTVREAVVGRFRQVKKDAAPPVKWAPLESDAVIRNTIVEGQLYNCPRCERDLPIGDGVDEIGVRRKRNNVRDGVEYVIRPQSYCHGCQRSYSRSLSQKV